MKDIIQLIRDRKSVRTFNGEPLSEEDVQKIKGSFAGLTTPFGVHVDCEFMNAKEIGAGSPVVVGTNDYVGFKVVSGSAGELSCGYAIEKFCLEAESWGIGTVILAATIKRSPFEHAMNVRLGEVMPVVTPVGYPAAKRSMRESLMRAAIRSDERIPFSSLFFDSHFGTPLSPDKAGEFRTALEMMRLAPSATNRQPWRVVIHENAADIYEYQTLKENALGDIQKVDVGIGVCNFLLTLDYEGKKYDFTTDSDPGISQDPALKYIATCTLIG